MRSTSDSGCPDRSCRRRSVSQLRPARPRNDPGTAPPSTVGPARATADPERSRQPTRTPPSVVQVTLPVRSRRFSSSSRAAPSLTCVTWVTQLLRPMADLGLRRLLKTLSMPMACEHPHTSFTGGTGGRPSDLQTGEEIRGNDRRDQRGRVGAHRMWQRSIEHHQHHRQQRSGDAVRRSAAAKRRETSAGAAPAGPAAAESGWCDKVKEKFGDIEGKTVSVYTTIIAHRGRAYQQVFEPFTECTGANVAVRGLQGVRGPGHRPRPVRQPAGHRDLPAARPAVAARQRHRRGQAAVRGPRGVRQGSTSPRTG